MSAVVPTVVGFVDEGIGHSSYLVDLGDGTALVIDARRIPETERAEAADRGLRIAFCADTHSHADFISGGPELAAQGATFLAPADAHLAVPHTGLRHGDRMPVGTFVLKAIATPGHTPEHLAYLLSNADGTPLALFSGGSLMVGTVGRTDLLGPVEAEPLARRLFRSLRDRLLSFPDELAVYPTHGAGSFCSAPGSTERTTTIGRERAENPLLQIDDEEQFVRALLDGFASFPPYFARLPEVNRRGPTLYGAMPRLGVLDLAIFRSRLDEGAQLVDVRPLSAFAAAHIPGALSIQLRPVFATWLGWLVDPARPVVFVLDDDQDRHELVRQCLTVGIEDLAGELSGGIETWRQADLEIATTRLTSPDGVEATVVDVRQRDEYRAGHLPGSHNIELGELVTTRDVPFSPITVLCGHGERAMTAASLLERAGRDDVRVLVGGPQDWAAATRSILVTGD